jgi:hypothetical protein
LAASSTDMRVAPLPATAAGPVRLSAEPLRPSVTVSVEPTPLVIVAAARVAHTRTSLRAAPVFTRVWPPTCSSVIARRRCRR